MLSEDEESDIERICADFNRAKMGDIS